MTERAPLKVLHVVYSLHMGGAETWLMELLRHWSKSGQVQVHFLCTGGIPGIFDKEALSLGARLHSMPYGRIHLARFIKNFRDLLRAEHFDAIHDHSDYAAGWRLLIGSGALPPTRVVHIHNPWMHITANYAVSPLRWLTVKIGKQLVQRLATHVTGTSEEVLRHYGFPPGKVGGVKASVLHCGFDVDKFNIPKEINQRTVREEFGWSSEAKIVLFAGRLDRSVEFDHPLNHKNSGLALHVVNAAIRKDPSVCLLMAGASSEALPEMERQIDTWGMGGKMRLLGVRHDLPRLLRAADVLLFPSRQEGLGMVAVEAQAAGLPVLASNTVPRESIILPELYDVLDLNQSLDHWADALLLRIDKPRPTPEACHWAVKNSAFSVENSARQLQAVYGSHRS